MLWETIFLIVGDPTLCCGGRSFFVLVGASFVLWGPTFFGGGVRGPTFLVGDPTLCCWGPTGGGLALCCGGPYFFWCGGEAVLFLMEGRFESVHVSRSGHLGTPPSRCP